MRQCGSCSLCCTLLPVRAINKLGGHKCQHQRFGKGCTIYSSLERVAPECRLWNCRWLVADAGDVGRPDHSHVVIDIFPDIVSIVDNQTGKLTPIRAAQVWISPKHREAADAPALREWIEAKAVAGEIECAIIRFSPSEGFVLFPPHVTGCGWRRDDTPPRSDVPSLVDMMAAS